MTCNPLFPRIQQAIRSGDLQQARALAHHWLDTWSTGLPRSPDRALLRQPDLWRCIADVVERTNDQRLIERFWQALDNLAPPAHHKKSLPLLGIPILNGYELLERLLHSIDYPVDTLAIVDNSHGELGHNNLSSRLDALRQLGHPLIQQIRIARPFGNLGVAASWNLMLTSFPEASIALLANHDVVFAPGVLQQAMHCINSERPQILPLLPHPNGFSAFLLTALSWDQIGLFDPGFHPAYYEDIDYRDRIHAAPAIEQLDGSFAHQAMASLNSCHSATIRSDPALAKANASSFQLNRLWYLSHRRLRHDPRGTWRRLWLSQWKPPSQT